VEITTITCQPATAASRGRFNKEIYLWCIRNQHNERIGRM